jgi:hypothetical protein
MKVKKKQASDKQTPLAVDDLTFSDSAFNLDENKKEFSFLDFA